MISNDQTGLRVKKQLPTMVVNRGKKIKFFLGKKEIEAYEGETIAAALYASGIKIFSRSFKYHRPRGFLCVAGKCAHCLMRVNGIPNVRICKEQVKEGIKVEAQNCWPSVSVDLFSILDHLGFFVSPDFYYRKLYRPKFLLPFYQKMIRRMAGMAKIPNHDDIKQDTFLKEDAETDLAVVGGGIAGLSAAIQAASLAIKVVLIDDDVRLGGKLKVDTSVYNTSPIYSGMQGYQIVEEISQQVKRMENIKILKNATALGLYDDHYGFLLCIDQNNDKLVKLKTKQLIIATGSYEKMPLFENNDLPGIFFTSGVKRLTYLYGVKPGEEIVIMAPSSIGQTIALQLMDVGVTVKALITPEKQFNKAKKLVENDVQILTSSTIIRALGRKYIKGVIVSKINEDLGTVPGTEVKIECDALCVSAGFSPASELLFLIDCEMRRTNEGFVPLHNKYMATTKEGIFVAGDVTGIKNDLNQILLEGKIAGISAALKSGIKNEKVLTKAFKEREYLCEQLDKLRLGERSHG